MAVASHRLTRLMRPDLPCFSLLKRLILPVPGPSSLQRDAEKLFVFRRLSKGGARAGARGTEK